MKLGKRLNGLGGEGTLTPLTGTASQREERESTNEI